MSEHVYIAKANDSNAPSAILRPLLYHLSIARSIDNALTTIERYWPTVHMERLWDVRADNRADMLWRYLELRFRARLFKPAWYCFTDSDLAFIKSITDENFVNFLNTYGFCVRCGFGIEINIQHAETISAEFYQETPQGIVCYYCKETKLRNIPALYRDACVLLKSAHRLGDGDAIGFYTRQVRQCEQALAIDKESDKAEAQGALF